MEECIVKRKIPIKQSGVIPYYYDEGILKVLVVSSVGGKKWIFPKGFIEPGFSSQDSAAKEAYEEAGIQGIVGNEVIGKYTYERDGIPYIVEMYAMKIDKIKKTWPERKIRKRMLMEYERTGEYLKEKNILKILENLKEFI